MNFKVSQLKSLTAGEVAVDDLIYVIDSNPTDGSVKSKKVTVGDLIDSRIYGISSSQFVLITGYYADPSWITSLDWSKITNAPSFVTSLSALTDVQLSTPLSGQALVYNGTKWVNQGIGELDTLATVTTRGNTTTNPITVGALTVATNLISTDIGNSRVGIGTTSPAYKLEVIGTPRFSGGSAQGAIFGAGTVINLGSDAYMLATSTAGKNAGYTISRFSTGEYASFDLLTAASLGSGWSIQMRPTSTRLDIVDRSPSDNIRMTFFNGGNIAIGTTTDSGFKLDVNGTTRLKGNVDITTSGGTNVLLAYSSYVQAWQSFYVSQSGGAHNFAVSNASSGGTAYFNNVNVGIGTTTPTYNLEVSSTTGTEIGIVSGANTIAQIDFRNRGYGLPRWTIRAGGAPDGSSGNLTFQRLGSTFPFTITSGDNVLIGIGIDAGYKLDVNGSLRTTGILYSNNNLAVGNYDPVISPSGSVNLSVYSDTSFTPGRIVLGGSAAAGPTVNGIISFANNRLNTFYPGQFEQAKIESYWAPNAQTGGDLRFYTRTYTSFGERLRITDIGNILINTTTDSGYKLDVNGTARIVGATRIDNLSGTGTRMVVADASGVMSTQALGISGSIATGQVAFGTGAGVVGGDNGLVWDNVNKRLGIGTTSPDNKISVLSIAGEQTIINIGKSSVVNQGVSSISFGVNNGTYNSTGLFNYEVGLGFERFVFSTGSTANLLAIRNDRVGIGTLSPGGRTEIRTTNDDGLLLTASSVDSTFGPVLAFQTTTGSTGIGSGSADVIVKGHRSGLLRFSNRIIGNTLDIASTGNVLIGTTTDAGYKLDVNGNARVRGTSLTNYGFTVASSANNLMFFGAGAFNGGVPTISSATGRLFIYPTEGTLARYVDFSNTSVKFSQLLLEGEGNQNNINLYVGGNGALRLTTTNSTNSIEFFTNNINRASIVASTGNFLINTTTDAGYKLDVNGTMRVQSSLYASVFYSTSASAINFGYNGENQLYYNNSNLYPRFSRALGLSTNLSHHWSNLFLTGYIHLVDGVTSSSSYLSSAKLQIDSTTQGFLRPRMTTAQKNAIVTPAAGLEVYDSTTNTPNYFNGTTWVGVASNQSTGLSPGLFSQTSDSAAVTNTTVESSLISTGVGTLSVPANGFQVGAAYIAYLSGVMSSQNNATMEIHLRSNGFVLADTDPMILSATTGKFWELHVNFVIRAIGGGGVAAIVTSGRFSYNKDSGNIPESLGFSGVNNTTFDTTINNTLTVTATWGNASPSNSIQTRIFNLYRVY